MPITFTDLFSALKISGSYTIPKRTSSEAEIAAGSIAMGLGGYLAARSDAEHFFNERRREEQEIVEKADVERQEIVDLFQQYGVTAEECAPRAPSAGFSKNIGVRASCDSGIRLR